MECAATKPIKALNKTATKANIIDYCTTNQKVSLLNKNKKLAIPTNLVSALFKVAKNIE